MATIPTQRRGENADADTADGFLGGRLTLRQPARGHRFGSDAALLAACAPTDCDGEIMDVGAGVGAVGLAAASRASRSRATLVEIDPALCALALANAQANGLSERVSVACADATSAKARRAAGLADGRADVVLSNPPYLDAENARLSPDGARRRAHAGADAAARIAFLRAACALARPGGLVAFVHRADALPMILQAVEGRLGGLAVVSVAARDGAAATRVLVRGTKGSRAPFSLGPTLALHGADGRFTAQAEAIHRGEAGIAFA